jgi:AraC-like DNA-binding protein/mannose-6-phosphate isomerase-like protein (cupin superfamily)
MSSEHAANSYFQRKSHSCPGDKSQWHASKRHQGSGRLTGALDTLQTGMPERIERDSNEQVVDTWRVPGYDWIELHRGASITMDYARHWHDELYLCAVLDGEGDLVCLGGSYATPPGALVLIPSGEIHSNRKRECSFRCMFIEFPALQSAVEQFTEQSIPGINFRMDLIYNSQTVSRFLRLHRALESPGSRLQRDNAVLRFFHRLVRRHSTASVPLVRDGSEGFAVQRTKQFLDEHYAEQVSLNDLARLTRLSPYYLHRSFCRKVGMPPHAYQLQVRVSRARSFLRRGRSISDAASAAGFVDQSHFTRHFKKFTGFTPGRYLHLEQERTRRPLPQSLTSLS